MENTTIKLRFNAFLSFHDEVGVSDFYNYMPVRYAETRRFTTLLV